MNKDEKLTLLRAASEIRSEYEQLSDLLTLPEVCSDARLLAHYSRRQRDVTPVVAALAACEDHADEEDFEALRREMMLLSVTVSDASRAYKGAGICVRMRDARIHNIDDAELMDLWHSLMGKLLDVLPRGVVNAFEAYSDLFIAKFFERGALDVLSALKPDYFGVGDVRLAVFPILDVPKFSEEDVRTDLFLNGGKGGQNVNKVETAVRMTHLPTGVTVTCREERSQLQNKKRALQLLRERVRAYYEEAQEALVEKAKAETLS